MVALSPIRAPCAPGRSAAGGCAECLARPFSVCAAVPDAELAELEALSQVRTLAPGEALFRQDDPATEVFNVSSGSLRFYRLAADGRRQILGFLFAGDFVGLSGADAWLGTAEAMEPATVCRFPRAAFEALTGQRRDLAAALLGRAGAELAASQAQVLRLGGRAALPRLAGFLRDLPRTDPLRPGAPGQIRLPMTRGEIADYLGLTLETVSRALSDLKRRGVLSQVSLHELHVDRPDALDALAEG